MKYISTLFIFIISIYLAIHGLYSLDAQTMLIVALYLIIVLLSKKQIAFTIFVICLTFTAHFYTSIYVDKVQQLSTWSYHNDIGTIDEIKVRENSVELHVKLKKPFFPHFLTIIQTESKVEEYKLGSQISISCHAKTIAPTKNFKSFNFQTYAFKSKRFGQCFNPKIKKIEAKIKFHYRLKIALDKHISRYHPDLQPLLRRTILRDKESGSAFEKLLTELSLTHLFMLSSFMLKKIEKLLLFLLSYTKIPLEYLHIFIKMLLCLFVLIIGIEKSYGLTYFFFSQIILIIAQLRKQKLAYHQSNKLKRLLTIHSFLLILNPYQVTNIGFYYLLIIQLYYIIYQTKQRSMLQYFFPTLLLFPIQIALSPALKIKIILATIFHALSSTILTVAIFIVFIMPQLTFVILPIIHFHEQCLIYLQGISETIQLSFYFLWQCLLFLCCMIFLIECFLKKKRQLLAVLCILSLSMQTIYFNQSLTSIHFIQLPEGEAMLIKEPNHAYMIDVGGGINEVSNRYMIEKTLLPLFETLNITELEAVIITHEDQDHIGNLALLIELFSIRNVYLGKSVEISDFESIIATHKKNTTIHQVTTSLNVGPFTIFPELFEKDYSSPNNRSLVILGNIGGRNWLFMGDLEKEGEHELLRRLSIHKKIDYLKIGHHGSKTSSTNEFIRKITPKYAIIVVQTKNRFNHPHLDVTERLERYKIKYVDTNLEGGKIIFLSWKRIDWKILEKVTYALSHSNN